ncbi:MAG: hypothetical protein HON70_35820, partial [Lentisphaerae bacterium]|nr:hypothetical protein [Lentisphaerota bacterium]
MSESTPSGASATLRLTIAQLPLMLRSFCRQKALVFWTYGFSVAVLFFACTILAGMAGSGDVLRPPLASAVMMLTVMCAGLFGVNQGVWEFFGGGTLERYRRAPCGNAVNLSGQNAMAPVAAQAVSAILAVSQVGAE